MTHLPLLFSEVTDKESQRVTKDLSVREAGHHVHFKFLSFVTAKFHETLFSLPLPQYSSGVFLFTATFT